MQKTKFKILTILLMAFLTAISDSHEVRIWTHKNGKKMAGTLLEYKNEEAKIKRGENEVVVKLQDLSPEDQTYLSSLASPAKNDIARFIKKQPDYGVCQKFLDLGENKTPLHSFVFEKTIRATLTKMVNENPDRKIFWILSHHWIQGRGKCISYEKLIYLKETKELIWMCRQELDFEDPQNHSRWHKWTHWKNIEPSAWEKAMPPEEDEFATDYDPVTAKKTFKLSNPDVPELMEWP